eukprot:5585391-Prorocentrum_lima.AAC.1
MAICEQQRNRLRQVRGFTPVQHVFCIEPHSPGELDEDLGLADVTAHEDPRKTFARVANLRAEAGN